MVISRRLSMFSVPSKVPITSSVLSILAYLILIDGMWKAGRLVSGLACARAVCPWWLINCAGKWKKRAAYRTPSRLMSLFMDFYRKKEVEKAMNRLEQMCKRKFSADGVTATMLSLDMKDD
ncbi:hypothetical protein V6N13_047510 [Hibiscus sabdariffa]